MKLSDLAQGYAESEKLIGARLKELRAEARATDDPALKKQLERRILELKPLYTEVRDIKKICLYYYERSFWRNGKYTQ